MFKPIPSSRTCETAGIAEHWCMCHTRYNVSHDDEKVIKSTDYLVSKLNRIVKPFQRCAKLTLSRIIDAKALSDPGGAKTLPPWIDYSVTLETLPGNAVFEGSVRYQKSEKSFKLIDTISRLNAYGNQSACIDDFHARLYCYCV